MGRTKRRRLPSSLSSDSYLAELNDHSNVPMTIAPPTALSCATYLDELNQRHNFSCEGGASDSSASGESGRHQSAYGCAVSGSASGESRQHGTAANCAEPNQRRGVPLGDLKLGEKLGSGAFGTVFECTWQGRQLAVKIFRNDERAAHDAARELELLKHLHKPRRCSLVCHLQGWRKSGNIYRFFSNVSIAIWQRF